MKNFKYFMFAAAATLFAACSNDDGLAPEQQQETAQTGQVAVAFDAYTNRATRAGLTGVLTNEAGSLQESGFGVFAYYTNADFYDPSSFMPNFMYNQRVTYDETWSYTPIKYWPNEFGNNARSEDVDKISFFAYAPYVSVNTSSGKVIDKHTGEGATYDEDNGEATMGIVGMTRNNVTGDPMVKYISTFYTDNQVDLVWGTIPASQTWTPKNGGTAPTMTEGKPWLNMEHPSATSVNAASKVKFQFLHSLASLNVTVDTKANSTDPASVDETDNTKVYIRSVTFEGFDTKGALNLNNTEASKPLWYNFNCNDELNNGSEITIKDGRKDGKEGINAATSEYAAINPDFVQSVVWGTTGESDGVIGTPANLFCKKDKSGADASTDPIFVIPNDDPLKVTIEYDVLTADENLVGKLNDGQTRGSVVKNVITRYITTDGKGDPSDATKAMKLENGKLYKIALHLGLNSVEFDAAVTAWPAATTGGADLPHNNAGN